MSAFILHDNWRVKDETSIIDSLRKCAFTKTYINCRQDNKRIVRVHDFIGFPLVKESPDDKDWYVFQYKGKVLAALNLSTKFLMYLDCRRTDKVERKLFYALKMAFFDTFKTIKTTQEVLDFRKVN